MLNNVEVFNKHCTTLPSPLCTTKSVVIAAVSTSAFIIVISVGGTMLYFCHALPPRFELGLIG